MRIRWFSRRRKDTAPSRPHSTNAPYRAPDQGPSRPANLPVNLPAWMTQPTLAEPQPGRVGWLTPAQQWRANGGHW
ncbi:hypothetical protein [Salinispora oceanensis]|uniref:hypothetical protein n=1 Tax=Salinispora oceanensis TaxID=1050199 RepID=UPI0003A2B847|nr:hypothetical protein [Salinispora oceanensis]